MAQQQKVTPSSCFPADPTPELARVPNLLFSQKESARILGVSLRTLQNLISAKELPVRRIGRRVLIHRNDLEVFARRDHLLGARGGE